MEKLLGIKYVELMDIKKCNFTENQEPLLDKHVISHVRDIIKCGICLHFMTNPISTDCGHNFCTDCIIASRRITNICPTCTKSIGHLFINFGFKEMCRTMIQKKCGKGECTWKGPYEDETAHLKKCLYVEMKCKDCDNNFLKVNLPEHIKNECPNRIVPCPRCEYPNVFKNLNDHYNNDCYKTFVNCRRCDQQIIKAFETDHEKNECLLSTVTCKYRFVGCSHISQRENMIKHYADMREQHMAYLEHFFNMGNLSIVKPFEHPAKEIKFKTTDDTYI
jgi:hypothetical protein